MARRESELRHTVAHHAAVFIAGLRGTNDVALFVVDQPFAIGGVSGIFPHIEVAKRLAFLDALQVVERIGIFCAAHIIEVLTHILRVAEVDKLVAHGRAHDVKIIAEFFRLDNIEVQVELETGVLHRTYVDKSLVEEEWWNRHLVVAEQILLTAAEIVDRAIHTVVKQREVHSDVPVLSFLPFQVGIDVFRGSPHLEVFAIVKIVTESGHGVQREITAKVLVSCHTIVGAQLQVVNPLNVFHEFLRGDAPSGRDSWEITPFVVCTEF